MTTYKNPTIMFTALRRVDIQDEPMPKPGNGKVLVKITGGMNKRIELAVDAEVPQ